MKKILSALVMALAACTPTHGSQTPHTSGAAKLEAMTVALVMPAADDGVAHAYCSGVWVYDDKILTAFHCVADELDAPKIAFVTRGDVYAPEGDDVVTLRTARLVDFDAVHDLALLGVRLPPAHPIASVGRGAYVGQIVQTMGHPRGLWWSYSAGNVAAVRTDEEGMWYVQSTAPISPGNSGGGLFSEDGELLGVAHSYMPVHAENINLYVDARYVRTLLEGKGK